MGPIWGRQDPGGPHVGPINFTIWEFQLTRDVTQLTIWDELQGVNVEQFRTKDREN